jgi:hypothetical protein
MRVQERYHRFLYRLLLGSLIARSRRESLDQISYRIKDQDPLGSEQGLKALFPGVYHDITKITGTHAIVGASKLMRVSLPISLAI